MSRFSRKGEETGRWSARVLAPAKVNLFLRVGALDGSGYHPLAAWFCTVGLFDSLFMAFEPAGVHAGRGGEGWVTLPAEKSAGEPLTIRFRCDGDADVPADQSNLVILATRRVLGHAGIGRLREGATLSVRLRKSIPAAAGLGGGSSDAAAMIRSLGTSLVPRPARRGILGRRIMDCAASVGSDVPFFASGETSAICSGRGEVVRATPPPKRARWALIVVPEGIRLATAAVYRRFDELSVDAIRGVPSAAKAGRDARAMAAMSCRDLLERLENDLEPAAFSLAPRLAEIRSALERIVNRPVRMSGSGSALFTLFATRDGAVAARGKVAAMRVARNSDRAARNDSAGRAMVARLAVRMEET